MQQRFLFRNPLDIEAMEFLQQAVHRRLRPSLPEAQPDAPRRRTAADSSQKYPAQTHKVERIIDSAGTAAPCAFSLPFRRPPLPGQVCGGVQIFVN